jgi:hypothetical protein
MRASRSPWPAIALALACAHAQPTAPPPPAQERVSVDYVPGVAECATKNPDLSSSVGWSGEIRAEYDVDETGALHALRLDDFGDGAPEPVLRAIADWLAHCKFRPAQRTEHVSQYFDVSTHEPAIVGTDMTRPVPVDCPGPRPQTPEAARELHMKGFVLVSYIVHKDGRVTHVQLRNDAPQVLFVAVRDWLMSCRFTPSMHAGKPIRVKIIQPFNFTLR